MNNEELIRVLKNLICTVEDLSPDPIIRDEFNVDVVIHDARCAIIFLRSDHAGS